MDSTRHFDEKGFASAQSVFILALSFTVLFWFANLLFVQYERAAVNAALLDGARQAARIDVAADQFDSTECIRIVSASLRSTARGAETRATDQACTIDKTTNRVTASLTYKARTLIPMPGWSVPGAEQELVKVTVQRRTAQ